MATSDELSPIDPAGIRERAVRDRFNANPRNPWIEDLIEEIVETR